MLVVKIEMWPHGAASRAREIGRMYIANNGTESGDRGSYNVAVCRKGTDAVPKEIYGAHMPTLRAAAPKAQRAGRVEGYPRKSYNVWRLVARSLLAAFPEETIDRKKTARPLIDTFVLRGFELLAVPLRALLRDPARVVGLPQGQDGEAIHRALEYLDAAGNE